jgi:hypothetical protein
MRISRHWTPFFSFGYRGLSHFALLRRVVRGWRRGERLSSVPHHNDHSRTPQASITVLAARV